MGKRSGGQLNQPWSAARRYLSDSITLPVTQDNVDVVLLGLFF